MPRYTGDIPDSSSLKLKAEWRLFQCIFGLVNSGWQKSLTTVSSSPLTSLIMTAFKEGSTLSKWYSTNLPSSALILLWNCKQQNNIKEEGQRRWRGILLLSPWWASHPECRSQTLLPVWNWMFWLHSACARCTPSCLHPQCTPWWIACWSTSFSFLLPCLEWPNREHVHESLHWKWNANRLPAISDRSCPNGKEKRKKFPW